MLKPDNSILVFATIQILPQVLSVILVILAKSYNKDQANTWQLFNISFVFKIQSKHSDWIIALIHMDHFSVNERLQDKYLICIWYILPSYLYRMTEGSTC